MLITGLYAMLGLAGAQDVPAPPATPAEIAQLPGVDARTYPISELIGASPAQLRQKFGLRNVRQDSIIAARLNDAGGIVTTMNARERSGVNWLCSRSGEGPAWRYAEGELARPVFTFLDGRLTGIEDERAIPGGASLTALCFPRRSGMSVGERIVYAPIFGLIYLGYRGGPAEARAKRNLSRLELGKPPPGGLAAYAANLPDNFEINLESEDNAVIRAPYILRDYVPNRYAEIIVRNGRIVAFEVDPVSGGCVLTPTKNALDC